MRILLLVALCMASVMSMPLFRNAPTCGKVATNGRCAAAGGGGRCAWGYCSRWSWCGVGPQYQNGGQARYHHKGGCYLDSHWAAEKQKWEAKEATRLQAIRAAQLKKDQAAAAAHARAAAAAKKAHDAAKAKAEKEKADIAANKAKHDAAMVLLKQQMAQLLARMAAAKRAAAAQLLKDQREASAAAAKAAAAAKNKAAAAAAAKAAALRVARSRALHYEHAMAIAIRADEKKYEKRPAFKNPAKCPKIGIAANGRCGSAGTPTGGPKCQWGNCSQWLWCGVGAAYNGPHREWYYTPGCASNHYWAGQLAAWSKQAKLYQQWTTGWKAGLKSINSARKYKMTIINQTDQPLQVIWLDYKGAQKRYAILRDNQKWACYTYDTHPWVFKGNWHTVLGMFTGKAANANTVLELQPKKVVAH